MKEKGYQEALSNAVSLADNSDTTVAKHALYDAGNISWYRLNDKIAGRSYFSKLIATYPDDPLSHSAQSTLRESDAGSANQGALTTSSSGTGFELQNYPNPFNPTTTITYTIQTAGHVVLNVYDILGRTVGRLVDGEQQAGAHRVRFDAHGLASGVYFYQLIAPGIARVQKMMVQK